MFELTVVSDSIRVAARSLNLFPFKETVKKEIMRKYSNKVLVNSLYHTRIDRLSLLGH